MCSHAKDRILVESDTFVPLVSKNAVSVSDISAVCEFDCGMGLVLLCLSISSFYFGHEDVNKGYGHFLAHGCSMGLKIIFLVKLERVF